jgi:TIR domain
MKKASKYEYDIFLSHNSADNAWVADLAVRLEQEEWKGQKLKVFFSSWDIKPGQFFPSKIEEALKGSRKVGIVMSPGGMKSTWVKLERIVATYIAIEERDDRVIPLYRRTCRRPAFLKPIVYIDFREDSKFEESYRVLATILRDEPLKRVSRKASISDPSGGGNNKQIPDEKLKEATEDLVILKQFKDGGLISEGILVEYQRIILKKVLRSAKRSANG